MLGNSLKDRRILEYGKCHGTGFMGVTIFIVSLY